MSKAKLFGRKKEIQTLDQIWSEKRAAFVAVYGRRRVGKTYLIREYFSKKGTYMEMTGTKEGSLETHLQRFAEMLSTSFFQGIPIRTPSSWTEALTLFTEQLSKVKKNKKVVLFLDEFPWIATRKSMLVQSIDYFWNRFWSQYPNFILIVCGSAASWMLDHLVHAKGGLYNRVTKRIHLKPFTLRETQEFLTKQGSKFSDKQTLDIYMAIGGIAFYLNEVKKKRSAVQVIDDLCFREEGTLYSEFPQIFNSLFDQAEFHMQIVRAIAKAGKSISRNDLLKTLRKPSGGGIARYLYELEASGFIRSFIPYGKKSRDQHFRIIDEYTLFYMRWVEPLIKKGICPGAGHWQKMAKTPERLSWAGYAFETVCLKHADLIANALHLSDIAYQVGTWSFIPRQGSQEQGAQIDLLFDGTDGIITLCEIKYAQTQYTIDKPYARILANKIDVFTEKTKTKKEVELAIITTNGLKRNLWSEDLVQAEVILEDLFTQ